MQLDAHFAVNEHTNIRITIPNPGKKDTYYFAPSRSLHGCDVATVWCITPSTCIILEYDILLVVLKKLYHRLDYLCNNTNETPSPHIVPGQYGKETSKEFYYDDTKKPLINNYVIWSYKSSHATIVYHCNTHTYLEVSPL